MLTVSDSFKQAMHQSTKSLRSKLIAGDTVISDNDGLILFSIESDGYLFGSAVSIATVNLLGTNYDLVGRTIELKTSTKTDQINNTWEELSLGEFQVVEQQVDLEKGTTTLKCFDSLIALSKIPYIAGDLAFPNTIANIATQLATRHGLIIDETVASLPNASQIIAEDPYAKISNLTYRDILNEIAGATGTMAIIKNGKLYFQSAQKTSVCYWTYDHLKKINLKPKYGPINALVLARTPQEDNVALIDEASIMHPSTKNILNIASTPQSYTPNIDYVSEVYNGSSIKIRCNINNNIWANAKWLLPTKYMIAGKKYTLSYSKMTGNRPEQMLVSVNCYRKEDKKRVFIKDMASPNGDKVTFMYDPANFEGYYVSLHMSKSGNLLYTGEFNGTYHDLCLAEESVFNGFESFKPNGLTDIKLANNEILDDNRESLIQPLFNTIKDLEFYPFEAETEGHGYYQVGDRISLVNSKNLFNYKDPNSYLNGFAPNNAGTAYTPASTNTSNQNFISTLKVPVDSSKTYAISTKFKFRQLFVYESADKPEIGASLSLLLRSDNVSSATITTKPTTRWLIVKFYNTWTIEQHTYQDIVSTLQIEEGDAPTSYTSYIKNDLLVTSIKLDISQGIKEVIKGAAPMTQQTDYARAGGIMKTIFNTEIKVDKQNQEIKSIVEKTTELNDKIESNYTQITQNLTSITNTIQTTGGTNLLHNSVGYATDTNRIPTIWTKTGNVIANTSPESLTFGAKSGSQIILSPNSSIAQTIVVAHYQPVSISARVKKGLIGQATISISTNDSDKRTIEISNNQEYLWQEVKLDNFIPELSDLTVKVETTNNAILTITDLMLNVGDKTIPWQQASGEIYNTNVIIDIDGMIIKNSVYAGDYMKFTPLEIANYSNASGTEKKTFWLNRDLTNVQKLQAVDQITMPPVKIIPITETNRAGWAFVADKGEN